MKTSTSLLFMYLLLGLSLIGLSIGLDGCASGLNKKVDSEVAQETAVRTHSDLQAEIDQLVDSAPGLTQDQRKRLTALKNGTRGQLDTLYAESLRLRSLMLKKLITTNYNDDEVQLIKSKIKNVENDRLSVIFSAVEQANTILGHNSVYDPAIMNSFFDGMGHGTRD